MSILAVEIGGTKLQAALGTPDGVINRTERGSARDARDAEEILSWFDESVPDLLRDAERNASPVTSIGVGFGGPVETGTGSVIVSHQVSGWSGFALRDWFEDRFNLPVGVANDSSAAGWAEYCRGAGRGCTHFCYMNIGSGIGGGLVIDGKLHDGQGRGASEIGHTYVPNWQADAPGQPAKLEDLCSGWAIERYVKSQPDAFATSALAQPCQGNPERFACAMLGDAAKGGDAFAVDVIDRVAESISVALCNVLALTHVERIAMGGGVSLLGDVLLDPIRRHVAERVFGPYQDRYEIVPCELGESVVLVGALLLAPTG
jgi:glucokinase